MDTYVFVCRLRCARVRLFAHSKSPAPGVAATTSIQTVNIARPIEPECIYHATLRCDNLTNYVRLRNWFAFPIISPPLKRMRVLLVYVFEISPFAGMHPRRTSKRRMDHLCVRNKL
jgi:hypothetical protein